MQTSHAMFTPMAAVLLAACSGGGGGGDCVDVYANPDFDFMVYEGLDAADMNGDGLADLVASSRLVFGSEPEAQRCGGTARAEGSITVFFQDIGTPGRFLPPQRYPVSSGTPHALKLADLNGDALADVIVTNRWGSSLFQILLRDPLNVGRLTDAVAYATIREPHQIGVGDIDMDGRIDLAFAGDAAVAWHRQQSDGGFDERHDIGAGQYTLALVDFDADGLLDVAAAGLSDGDDNVLIYRQAPNLPGVFNLAQAIQVDAGIWTLAGGDLDADGRPDVAAAGIYSDNLTIREAWYRILQTSRTPLGFGVRSPRIAVANNLTAPTVIADLNGDQREDVIFGGGDGEVTVFMQTQTPGEFGPGVVHQLPPDDFGGPDPVSGLALADLNGDALPDIAVSHGEIFVLFQQAGAPGTFGAPVLVASWEL